MGQVSQEKICSFMSTQTVFVYLASLPEGGDKRSCSKGLESFFYSLTFVLLSQHECHIKHQTLFLLGLNKNVTSMFSPHNNKSSKPAGVGLLRPLTELYMLQLCVQQPGPGLFSCLYLHLTVL